MTGTRLDDRSDETGSDGYGGERPSDLRAAITRLVGAQANSPDRLRESKRNMRV
jgi:hypothetical protein